MNPPPLLRQTSRLNKRNRKHVNMAAPINCPAKCELRSVIRFLQAGLSAAEIHQEMAQGYRENFISDGVVRECCRKFKDGRVDEERRPC